MHSRNSEYYCVSPLLFFFFSYYFFIRNLNFSSATKCFPPSRRIASADGRSVYVCDPDPTKFPYLFYAYTTFVPYCKKSTNYDRTLVKHSYFFFFYKRIAVFRVFPMESAVLDYILSTDFDFENFGTTARTCNKKVFFFRFSRIVARKFLNKTDSRWKRITRMDFIEDPPDCCAEDYSRRLFAAFCCFFFLNFYKQQPLYGASEFSKNRWAKKSQA